VLVQCFKNSLETAIHVNHCTGGCRHIVAAPALPLNWHEFHHVDNKTELFSFLFKFVIENIHDTAKQILATVGTNVMSATPVLGDTIIMPFHMRRKIHACCCMYFMFLRKALLRQ
jgi:hypothetical protein